MMAKKKKMIYYSRSKRDTTSKIPIRSPSQVRADRGKGISYDIRKVGTGFGLFKIKWL